MSTGGIVLVSIIGALALVIVAIGVWLVADGFRLRNVSSVDEYRSLSRGIRAASPRRGGAGWAAGAAGVGYIGGSGPDGAGSGDHGGGCGGGGCGGGGGGCGGGGGGGS